MKYLLATLAGAALTLCIFAGGVAFAITFLAADLVPVKNPSIDTSLVFRTDVVKVDPEQQDYERVEARDGPERTIQTGAFITGVDLVPGVGDIAIATNDVDLPNFPSLSDEHANWCQNKYRSYQSESNSYTPYGGGSSECVSPFSTLSIAGEDEAILLEASASESSASEHVASCFERYRSYRSGDNTYQPHSGGPRAQCE